MNEDVVVVVDDVAVVVLEPLVLDVLVVEGVFGLPIQLPLWQHVPQ